MNPGILCNDVHSCLNPVRVAKVLRPRDANEVAAAIAEAAGSGVAVSICGARHAMGGQQFGEGTLLLDLSDLKNLGPVDRGRGLVEAGAGMTWPELIAGLHADQDGEDRVWSIRQKQTGADNLTLGGSLAANIHGRGLRMTPLIGDVEAFTLVDASGRFLRCSRENNDEWFRLVIGGYGCFGVITSVCLRLAERLKIERRVEVTSIELLLPALEERSAAGCLFGDFQFSIDERSADFLRRGVLSTYRPVEEAREREEATDLGAEDWEELIHLAHTDRAKVFDVYSAHYLRTNGAIYWTDTHQLGVYLDGYHEDLDARLGTPRATEMITELYVPRDRLTGFMARVAAELKGCGIPVIYGTVRLIERDGESFLAWAREDFACVIFNLHTEHSDGGIDRAAAVFRELIDHALSFGGSYFLTYHRWARRDQVERAYPAFREFLAAKERLDPAGRFQSEWWRHYRDLFAGP